jgi:hypothetical protein
MSGSSTSFLGMSDEEFLNQQEPDAPVGSDEATSTDTSTETGTQEVETEVVVDTTKVETEVEKVEEPEQTADTTTEDTPNATAGSDDSIVGSKTVVAPESTTGKDVEKDKAHEPNQSTESEAPNFKTMYEQIMAPFKANGKMIELKSPEEAIQLMQMGANYTQKMQQLVPHRKLLMMLENNGLLDEGKLSFLIDIEKKDPEAIKKLVKDAGIDPMEIDTNAEPAYREGNHRVTDEEAIFHSALDDLKSTPAGMETLQIISTNWDKASKDVLWQSPEIMGIIKQQRENGIYDHIASEVDRQRILGTISPTVSFLQAYKTVGDQMVAQNAFADLPNQQTTKTTAPVVTAPIATRVQAPKPTVTNNERANAASPTRPTASKAKEVVNPLAMSDDEFLKQMAGRV